MSLREADSGGGRWGAGGVRPPFFANTWGFFCNHFEELQTVLFEVEMIIKIHY